jgi:hypothetical protein
MTVRLVMSLAFVVAQQAQLAVAHNLFAMIAKAKS